MENKIDYDACMTDQMKAVIAKQNELVTDAFATDVSLEEMRSNYTRERVFWNEGGPVMAEQRDETVHGRYGDFRIRVYRPVADVVLPGIVFIHGGGFVVGNCDTHDRVCRLIADRAQAAVVSVDYHLSPESHYPQNIEECVQVAQMLHEHGEDYGIDGNDLSFAGDSGGAVLSMASCLWLRDECGDNSFIRGLILYYGYYGLTDSCSRRLFGNAVDGMTKQDLDYYNECWIGKKDLSDFRSPYFDMLHNDLKTSMPAVYIASAGLDPLRDDSACLHAILDQNGVPNLYENYEGVIHAFIHYSRMLDETNECIDHSVAFWKTRNDR